MQWSSNMSIMWSCFIDSCMLSVLPPRCSVTLELYCYKIRGIGSFFLCLAEQISKLVLMWVTAALMLITEKIMGQVYGVKCLREELRLIVSLSFRVHERGVVYDQRWGAASSGVPSRTRLLLFEATPSDSLNDIGDPRRFWEGNQNRRHSHHPFPPLEDEKASPLAACFGGFPNFIFSLLC